MSSPPPSDRRRAAWWSLLAAVSFVLVAVLLVQGGLRPEPGSERSASGTEDPCGDAGAGDGLKPVLTGLVGIGGVGEAGDVLAAATVNIAWSDLQPERGGGIVHPNPLDEAVERARAADGCRYLKVRLMAGTSSPTWVKRLDGAPVPMDLVYDGRSGTVPRFWTDSYMDAYTDLMAAMAEEYDDEWRLREVTVSACTTFWAEPLLRQSRDSANMRQLLAAGYDSELDLRCQRRQLEAHDAWQRTRSSLALNPYESIVASGEATTDTDVTRELAEQCREVLGDRCVLANNSVRWPLLDGPYADVYQVIDDLGPPSAYQLAGPARVGDVVAAVSWAEERGASSVEIVPGLAARNASDLRPVADRLRG